MAKLENLTAATIEDVGMYLGVSARQVSSYLARGCPGSRGKYPLPEILAWVRFNVWEKQRGTAADQSRNPAATGIESDDFSLLRSTRSKSLQKLADIVGVELSIVREWSADPECPAAPDGSFSLMGVCLWLLRSGRMTADGTTETFNEGN